MLELHVGLLLVLMPLAGLLIIRRAACAVAWWMRPFSQQRMSSSGSHGAALCVDVHTCGAVNVSPTPTFSSYILIAAWQADAAAAAVITHGGVVPARMGALGY